MSLTIESEPSAGAEHLRLVGVIDESSDLSPLTRITGRVEINLRGVRRINSFGARHWMDAVRTLTSNAHVTFVECSTAIIDQLNMIQGFLGHATVRSFCAPMICPHCDEELIQVFDTNECREFGISLPDVECPTCARVMQLDDMEDQYLLFLREPTVVEGELR